MHTNYYLYADRYAIDDILSVQLDRRSSFLYRALISRNVLLPLTHQQFKVLLQYDTLERRTMGNIVCNRSPFDGVKRPTVLIYCSRFVPSSYYPLRLQLCNS